jgi:CheY-like chemotaxis protein
VYPERPSLFQRPGMCVALLSGLGETLGEKDMIPGDRILVVDDSDAIRQILVDALEEQGYRVQAAADGRQAWDLLRRNPLCYDLVITDMIMPAMNGVELLASIMADLPRIKVIRTGTAQ